MWNELKPGSESAAASSEESGSNLYKIQQKPYNCITDQISKINSSIICTKIKDLKNIQKKQKDIIKKWTIDKTKIDIPQKLTAQRYVHTSVNLFRHGDIYMRTKLWNLSKEHKQQTNKLEHAVQDKFGKVKFDDPQKKVKNRYSTHTRIEEMKGLCDHGRFNTGYKKCQDQNDGGICIACRVEKPKLAPCRPIKRVELTTECPKCPKCDKQERFIQHFKLQRCVEKPKETTWK